MTAVLNHLLSSTLVLPIAGAAAILLLTGNAGRRARWIAIAASLAGVFRTAGLWLLYDADGKTWQFAERFDWVPAMGVALYFGVDGTSLLFLVLTSLIAAVAVLASWNDVTIPARGFYAWLLAAEAGLFGVFVALDLLQFFVCWQIVIVSVYFLLRHGGAPHGIARRFLRVSLPCSALMLGGMLALYLSNPGGASTYSADIAILHTRALSPVLQAWVFVALAVAFAGTLSIVPLHRWMVDAESAGPTAGSLLIGAVLTKMGAYGFFRLVLPVVPDASRRFAPVVAGIAIVAIVCGAILAWRQQDLRRLIGYATASHAGVMMAGLFTLTSAGLAASIVQQFGHAIWIAASLLCAAIVYERSGARDVRGVDGLRRSDAVLAILFCVIVLAGIRFSTTLGMVGEGWGIRDGVTVPRGWPIAAAASLVLTLGYMVPLLRRAMSGQADALSGMRRTLSAREVMLLVLLAVLAVGVAVYPKPLLDRIEPSVSRVVARIHPELAPYLRLGSDCPTQAPPDPGGPPPGFILVQPCAEPQ